MSQMKSTTAKLVILLILFVTFLMVLGIFSAINNERAPVAMCRDGVMYFIDNDKIPISRPVIDPNTLKPVHCIEKQ